MKITTTATQPMANRDGSDRVFETDMAPPACNGGAPWTHAILVGRSTSPSWHNDGDDIDEVVSLVRKTFRDTGGRSCPPSITVLPVD